MFPVIFLDSGSKCDTFELKGSDIVDLEMVQKPVPQPPVQSQPQSQQPYQQAGRIASPYREQSSYNTTPTPLSSSQHHSPQRVKQQQPQLVDPAILSAAPMSAAVVAAPHTNVTGPSFNSVQMPYSQQAVTPFPRQEPATDYYDNHSSSESSVDSDPYTAEHAYKEEVHNYFENEDTSRQYKQSPINSASGSRSVKRTGRPNVRTNGRQRSQFLGMESDGWATEDVTDFKDTEFDFQANLDRFDKNSVFKEIRQSDPTLPSDRLVAFNKVQTAGISPARGVASNGQIKYGHKEMVLQNKTSEWELSEDEDRNREYAFDNEGDDDESFFSDILSAHPPPPARHPSRPQLSADSVKLVSVNTKKTCLCTSPVQMVALERLMSDSFGIPHTILTENAGRGVARLALQSLGGSTRFTYGNHNSRPLVVVFVGNSRTGARALAAARHLANRQVRIVTLTVGCVEDGSRNGGSAAGGGGDGDGADGSGEVGEGADEVLPEIKVQLKALKSCKGTIVTRFESFMGELSQIDSPPELVIDGLQGYQTTLEDLLETDLVTVKSCIDWANNRQKASIVSLDIPSGLDSATGMPGSNSIKHMNAKLVLSCGLPLTGIKNAYLTGTVTSGDWTHYVVDVGFPRRSLQRGSLRRFGQMWFGAEWLLPLDVVIEDE